MFVRARMVQGAAMTKAEKQELKRLWVERKKLAALAWRRKRALLADEEYIGLEEAAHEAKLAHRRYKRQLESVS